MTVPHYFDRQQTVEAVMMLKGAVRPSRRRKVVPLRVSEVRQALRYAACHGDDRSAVLQRYAAESADGELHALAEWITSELDRLGIFTMPPD